MERANRITNRTRRVKAEAFQVSRWIVGIWWVLEWASDCFCCCNVSRLTQVARKVAELTGRLPAHFHIIRLFLILRATLLVLGPVSFGLHVVGWDDARCDRSFFGGWWGGRRRSGREVLHPSDGIQN